MTNMSQNRTAPKWTLGARNGAATKDRAQTPGPGAYTEKKSGERLAPSWGFGTSTRDNSRSASAPGPGQYMPSDRNKQQAPLYGFGSASRDKRGGYSTGTPGPGSYAPNFAATRRDAPKYTATPRRDARSGGNGGYTSGTPGPGSYMGNKPATAPKWGFGTSTRGAMGNNNTPGPGAYSSRNLIGGGPGYTMRARHEHVGASQAHSTPGPGGYGGSYTQFG